MEKKRLPDQTSPTTTIGEIVPVLLVRLRNPSVQWNRSPRAKVKDLLLLFTACAPVIQLQGKSYHFHSRLSIIFLGTNSDSKKYQYSSFFTYKNDAEPCGERRFSSGRSSAQRRRTCRRTGSCQEPEESFRLSQLQPEKEIAANVTKFGGDDRDRSPAVEIRFKSLQEMQKSGRAGRVGRAHHGREEAAEISGRLQPSLDSLLFPARHLPGF